MYQLPMVQRAQQHRYPSHILLHGTSVSAIYSSGYLVAIQRYKYVAIQYIFCLDMYEHVCCLLHLTLSVDVILDADVLL